MTERGYDGNKYPFIYLFVCLFLEKEFIDHLLCVSTILGPGVILVSKTDIPGG